MQIGRILVAWLLVTIWFGLSLWVNLFVVAGVLRLAGRLGNGVMADIPRSLLTWRVVEAAVLTLFASLWFDSLGSGEWWLVFLLVSLLAVVPTQLLQFDMRRHGARFAIAVGGELLRYLVAGALLAWRLS